MGQPAQSASQLPSEQQTTGDQRPTAKQIEAALIRVRDTQVSVVLGPFTFSYAKERGIDFCNIEMNWVGRDVFAGRDLGPVNRTRFSGFGYGCVSLKRVSGRLAQEDLR